MTQPQNKGERGGGGGGGVIHNPQEGHGWWVGGLCLSIINQTMKNRGHATVSLPTSMTKPQKGVGGGGGGGGGDGEGVIHNCHDTSGRWIMSECKGEGVWGRGKLYNPHIGQQKW